MRTLASLYVLVGCSFTPGYLPGMMIDAGEEDIDASVIVTADARMPPGAGPCGKPGVLADDFADTATARTWTVFNAPQITEGNGELVIAPQPDVSDKFTGYMSNPTVDMRAAAVEIEVRESVADTGASALFGLSFGTEALGFEQHTGQLIGRAGAAVASVAYDPVAHRLWRIEHVAPMITLSTSPSGLVWTELVSAPAPSWLATSFITLGANNLAGVSAPGTVRFAGFNTYVPSATWCASANLVDAFDDGVIGNAWAYHAHTSNGCLEHETTGAARVDQNGTLACDAYYGASTLYSLVGSGIRARIATINTFTNGWITYIGVWDLEDRYLRLSFDQDTMCADGTNITRTCVSYVDAQDLWRIREDAGVVYWEVAQGPTPSSWRLVHSAPAPFPLTAVRPYFGTLTNRAINQVINLSVDRVN